MDEMSLLSAKIVKKERKIGIFWENSYDFVMGRVSVEWFCRFLHLKDGIML